ncbi:MAG: glycosyltransferase family 4 protein [Thermodesulfovibrionales bacterium]
MSKNNKIRIMQITHDLNIGGLQKIVSDIALYLDKSRYQVTVCALREGGMLENELVNNNIKVIKLPAAKNGVDYLAFWKLYKILRDERPHIIHTHNTQPFVEGGLAAWLARVPVCIHTEHGRQFPDKKRYMFAEWLFSHYVDQIVAVSESAKKDLVTYEKISSDKIQVIMNGIDGNKYNGNIDRNIKLKELGIDTNYDFILGFAGRLSPEKGLTYLLKAMSIIVSKYPSTLLLIAGEGVLMADLKKETEQLNLNNNIKFSGPRSDIPEIMNILDMFVLPSLREGLPLVLLEAAAASLPIVATDVGGSKDIVKDGVNGLLVKSQDEQSLAKAIEYLIKNNDIKKTFGRYSFEVFKRSFAIEKMIYSYEAIYEHCLTSKTRYVKV